MHNHTLDNKLNIHVIATCYMIHDKLKINKYFSNRLNQMLHSISNLLYKICNVPRLLLLHSFPAFQQVQIKNPLLYGVRIPV